MSSTTAPADTAPIDDSEVADTPLERPLNRVRAWELGLITALCLLLYIPQLGSYALWDPWETHYGEVARRMREEHDVIRLKWQNENFRSKPVLTFWLQVAGMKAFGVAEDGGWSGEMIASNKAQWALRLPFALFGVMGVVVLWWALARLYSKRVAWMAAVVLATSPYYFLITRQSITDMPSCAMFIASMALFLLAWLERPERPLPALLANPKVAARAQWPTWAFLGVFSLVVLGQLVYFMPRVAGSRWMLGPNAWVSGTTMMVPFFVLYAGIMVWMVLSTRSMRSVYLYWFYFLNGLAVLAKGPISPALCGMTMILFWLLTFDWKVPRGGDIWGWIKRIELLKGILIFLVVALPWHFAIFLKDGLAWLNEYVGQHILGRAFRGVFGDRGTFDYYFGQLGVGMWPWIAFVPAALFGIALRGRFKSREQQVQLFVALWAIVAFTFFSAVQTKFHHYILPAVPALCVLVAIWFDDVWSGKIKHGVIVTILLSLALLVATGLDLVTKQERYIHLFCFRYDRPWPYASPWNIDFTVELFVFGGLLIAGVVCMFVPVARRVAICVTGAAALAMTVFVLQVLIPAAAPHWGQRHLHETYYKNREIHGADLTYYGAREIYKDWGSGKDLLVKSVIPGTLHEGDPMKVTWELRTSGETVQQKGEMVGRVSRIDAENHRFWIEVSPAEREKIASLVEEGRNQKKERRRYLAVNADRLIAWQLNWRGENFYSGGEIWNPRNPDMQTVYMDTENKKFLEYLKPRIGQGRKFWIITEKGRLANLPSILPTDTAKKTLKTIELDNSSNKFGLGAFTLDYGEAEKVVAPSGPITPVEEVGTGGGP